MMKEKKIKYNLFSFYDRSCIQAHLEEMARNGWMLENIGSVFWHYRSIEPQSLHFSVNYFPHASAFDPEPSEKQQIFRDFCEHSGWKLAASSAQLEIYYNEADNPIPIETDASIELNCIHKSAKKTIIMSHSVFLVLAVLQLCMQVITFLNNPLYALSHNATIFAVFCWIIVLVSSIVELTNYYRWYQKAKVAALEHGTFVETHSNKTFQVVLLSTLLIGFIFGLTSLNSGLDIASFFLGIAIFLMLLLLVNGIKAFLKKIKVSARVNRTITILSSFILSFTLMGGLVFIVLKSISHGVFAEREPYKSYEYNGRFFDIYHDRLPLKIEDLLETDYEDYSYEKTENSSIFLSEIEVYQSIPLYDHGLPEMSYTITKIKMPFLYQLCFNEIYHQYDRFYDVSTPEHLKDHYVEIDASTWNANAAYQMIPADPDDIPWNMYLICYDDKLIEFDPIGFELTPNQIEIIVEKLSKL